MLFNVVFPGGIMNVLLDRRTIRQHLAPGPGAEVVAKGVHVGIGTDARVAEQIPGASKGLTALNDGERLTRALSFEVTGHANAGNAGADNQYVYMLFAHSHPGGICRCFINISARITRQQDENSPGGKTPKLAPCDEFGAVSVSSVSSFEPVAVCLSPGAAR